METRMGRKPKIGIQIYQELVDKQGIHKIQTIKEIARNAGLKLTQVQSGIYRAKEYLRRDGFFLRNGRTGSKANNTYKSGYYLVRLDKGEDILPPEDRDFSKIIRVSQQAIDLWSNIDWKKITQTEVRDLKNIRQRMVEAVLAWDR